MPHLQKLESAPLRKVDSQSHQQAVAAKDYESPEQVKLVAAKSMDAAAILRKDQDEEEAL